MELGLGKLPSNLSSASGLTVFNTVQTIYNVKDKQSEDPLEARSKQKTKAPSQAVEVGKDDMSALHGDYDRAMMEEGQGMFYFPEMGDLPTFDLPDALELPNIATDLQVTFNFFWSCKHITLSVSSG